MTKTQKFKKVAAWLMPDGAGIRRKLFVSVDVLLFALILMFCAAMLQNDHTTGSETKNAYAAFVEPVKNDTANPETSVSKIYDYRSIWERNLFNTSNEANPGSGDDSAKVKIILEKKDINLELVGTVVGDDPDLNRAFIFNKKTGSQEIYRTGDRIDIGLIKKILHAEVIISSENGDELLVFRIEDFPTISETANYVSQNLGNSVSLQHKASGWNSLRKRGGSVVLARKEVETSLTDIDTMVKQFEISPFVPGKESSGFRIGNIIPDSIFDKLGLRYGEAITAVNGESIAGPGEFFRRLKEGGSITIKLQKSRWVRKRTRFIHLDIG